MGSRPSPPDGLFNQKERVRLIVMLAGVALIVVALFFVQSNTGEKPASHADVPEAPPDEVVIAPNIDGERLASLVRDARTEDRVVLEGEALEAAFEESSALRDAVFEPLAGRALDAAAIAELSSAPSDHRGAVFRVRGRVLDVQQLAASSMGNPRNLVRLAVEDGGTAFLGVMLFPQGPPRVGDFLRFDGLFLKLFRDDTPEGWIEGPLLVGPRTWRSFPRLDPIEEIGPDTFADVRDDNVIEGSSGLPVVPFWSLVSYVKELEPGDVDWAAAPVLDNELISTIFADGSEWRGQPVRFPACMVLGIWNQAQEENPLRLEKMAMGWLGHQPWVGQAKLVHFVSPFENTEIRQRVDQVTARGFFFKNLAYEPKHGGAGIAPFFVIHSFEKFVVPPSKGLVHMMWVVGGILLGLLIAIVIMLRRDQAKSRALQEDLLRRRRMRRARVST